MRAGQRVGFVNTGGPDWRVTRKCLRNGVEGELEGEVLIVRQPVRGWRGSTRTITIEYGNRVLQLVASQRLMERGVVVASYDEGHVTVVVEGDRLLSLLLGCASVQAHVRHPWHVLL
jgi:hypothetical protein